MPRFVSVLLDVDSTLCGIEGIDWLAAQQDSGAAAQLAALTAAAMAGDIPLESIYASRMRRIRPDAAALASLAEAYRQSLATGAADTIRALRAAGVTVQLVSGGLRQAIAPLSRDLGFAEDELHAVSVVLDHAGRYIDFDRASPLATTPGKSEVVRRLALQAPQLAVGDGMSDAALRDVVDAFAVYTGFVRREPVVPLAAHECRSFAELQLLVLP